MSKIAFASAPSQDVPPAVPRLKSGNRPSKKRGTSEAIECASQRSAKPCAAFSRASAWCGLRSDQGS